MDSTSREGTSENDARTIDDWLREMFVLVLRFGMAFLAPLVQAVAIVSKYALCNVNGLVNANVILITISDTTVINVSEDETIRPAQSTRLVSLLNLHSSYRWRALYRTFMEVPTPIDSPPLEVPPSRGGAYYVITVGLDTGVTRSQWAYAFVSWFPLLNLSKCPCSIAGEQNKRKQYATMHQ